MTKYGSVTDRFYCSWLRIDKSMDLLQTGFIVVG